LPAFITTLDDSKTESLLLIHDALSDLNDRWGSHLESIDDSEEAGLDMQEFLEWSFPLMQQIVGKIPPLELTILDARYAPVNDQRASIDVTDVIKEYIERNVINITINNYTMGKDPKFGVIKQLQIKYILNGSLVTKKVKENEKLIIGKI